MNDDTLRLIECLASNAIPARIDVERSAKLLGFASDDLTVLMAGRLLTPLGKPAANAPKYFSAVEILQKAGDREWLDAATRRLSQHWRKKRERRDNGGELGVSQREIPAKTPSTNPSTTERLSSIGGRSAGDQRAKSGIA